MHILRRKWYQIVFSIRAYYPHLPDHITYPHLLDYFTYPHLPDHITYSNLPDDITYYIICLNMSHILICLNVSHIPICHELRNHRQPGNSNTTKPYGRHPIWHERRYMAILMSRTRCLCLTPGCSHHSEYQLTFTLPVLKIEVMPSIGVYGFLLE